MILLAASTLGHALIWVVIYVVAIAFLYWVNKTFIPEPFQKFGTLVLGLLIVLAVINFLLGLNGGGYQF